MNIADVLELALGRPPSMPVGNAVYAQQMEMLEREHKRFRMWKEGAFGPPASVAFVGWFADKPEAAKTYKAWEDAGKPDAVPWTLQNHLDAIGDHYRAASGILRGS